MKYIVLSGGSGTRLWPLSRKNFPKQFLKLKLSKDDKSESFFQKTLRRIIFQPESEIFIVTNEKYKFYVLAQIEELLTNTNIRPNLTIALEPEQKNTAPAIAFALKYAMDRGVSEEENFLVLPSDHLISPDSEFSLYVNLANQVAEKGYIVTFGVTPDRPETGYGYIKIKKADSDRIFYEVEEFTEKPDIQTALRYMKDGLYFWNSGIFAFKANTLIEEFHKYSPQIAEIFSMPMSEVMDKFKYLPSISLDYAIMEQTKKAALIPFKIFWSDVGSWESLYDLLEKDGMENAVSANSLTIDTKKTLIIGDKRLITTIGIDDHIIVETEDALLIAKKGECQKVKDIVEILSEKKSPQVEEHITSYRPWGSFTLLEKGERYKIKRITVNPGASLSLQMHHHRSEHWIVVRGTAKVTIEGKESFIHENESIYVPKSTLHRLENPGKIALEIIEVQIGEYIEEDDIKRFEDNYGRSDFQGV